VELFGIAAGCAAALAALIAIAQLLLSMVHERRRTQPIVINHAVQGPLFLGPSGGGIGYRAELRNEAGGPAFNVRFGIQHGHVRFPFTRDPQDPSSGSRQRVISSRGRLPESGGPFMILVPWQAYGLGVVDDETRVYWCRYENAVGRTWETRNPVREAAHMEIRRVRFWRLRERWEARRRRSLLERGTASLLADLRRMFSRRGSRQA
jgi:hypothetical protein